MKILHIDVLSYSKKWYVVARKKYMDFKGSTKTNKEQFLFQTS